MTIRSVLVLALLSVACARTRPAEPIGPASREPVADALTTDGDVLVVRFRDRSVPPPYHHSFTITVTPTEIVRTDDAYGELLESRRVAVEPAVFTEMVQWLGAAGVRDVPASEDDGCTGGTGHEVALRRGGTDVVHGSVEHCQGDRGSLGGDVAGFAAHVEQAAERLLPRSTLPRAR
ncbi:MAG: hypothetical protein K1X88_22350 [Nannocystaceae bacterium]|nr:hypothetical protein [Nannocystaceae bacterium]